MRSTLLIALLAGLIVPLRPLHAAEFRLEPEHSQLLVFLYKEGRAAERAHDHVIAATRASGTIDFEPENPSASSISITVPAGALEADAPALRERYGLEKTLEPAQRQEVQATMEGPRQLDVERYPLIRFTSTRIEPEGGGRYRVTGDFTLHGTTRTITFLATVTVRDGVFYGQGAFTFLQSDYGIKPYSAFLGLVRVRDEARLVFDLVGTP